MKKKIPKEKISVKTKQSKGLKGQSQKQIVNINIHEKKPRKSSKKVSSKLEKPTINYITTPGPTYHPQYQYQPVEYQKMHGLIGSKIDETKLLKNEPEISPYQQYLIAYPKPTRPIIEEVSDLPFSSEKDLPDMSVSNEPKKTIKIRVRRKANEVAENKAMSEHDTPTQIRKRKLKIKPISFPIET